MHRDEGYVEAGYGATPGNLIQCRSEHGNMEGVTMLTRIKHAFKYDIKLLNTEMYWIYK